MTDNPYTKAAPLSVAITERYNLCTDGTKETYHLTLDLGDSNFTYQPGDSIGIFSQNDPVHIEKVLKATNLSPDEEVIHPRTSEPFTLYQYLLTQASLANFSMPLIDFLQVPPFENRDQLKRFIHEHEVWDLLGKCPPPKTTAQEFVTLLMPLLPRFYSIASSQDHSPTQLDLTVAITKYETSGLERLGACSDYICNRMPLNTPTLPIYLHPNEKFRLPKDPNTPIIMIGPGTGVAPFRAFMQERVAKGSTGKNWLFFGEWTKAHHYFYEEYWSSLDNLKLDLAFSRDQDHKIYVQHRLLENKTEVHTWIRSGAVLYVCGDAHQMAKDVEQALLEIISKDDLKALRKEGRYQRDVY